VSQPYLTATQVSELLQVDESTVYRWALSDVTMPVLRIGGVVRFPRERLLTWLGAREQGSRRRPLTSSQKVYRGNVA